MMHVGSKKTTSYSKNVVLNHTCSILPQKAKDGSTCCTLWLLPVMLKWNQCDICSLIYDLNLGMPLHLQNSGLDSPSGRKQTDNYSNQTLQDQSQRKCRNGVWMPYFWLTVLYCQMLIGYVKQDCQNVIFINFNLVCDQYHLKMKLKVATGKITDEKSMK